MRAHQQLFHFGKGSFVKRFLLGTSCVLASGVIALATASSASAATTSASDSLQAASVTAVQTHHHVVAPDNECPPG